MRELLVPFVHERYALVEGLLKEKIEDKSVEQIIKALEEALAQRKAVTFNSVILENNVRQRTMENGQTLIKNHVYYLERISDKRVFLQDPIGQYHLSMEWEDLKEYFVNYVII